MMLNELANMHNNTLQTVLDLYDPQTEDWRAEIVNSFSKSEILGKAETASLIEEIKNDGTLDANSATELVELVYSQAIDGIMGGDYVNPEFVRECLDLCVQEPNKVTTYDEYVNGINEILAYAESTIGEGNDLLAIKSFAYIFRSTAYLWYPRELGGSGYCASFILSVNPEYDLGLSAKECHVPEWLIAGLAADGVSALKGGKGWKLVAAVASQNYALAAYYAARIGLTSVMAAVATASVQTIKGQALPENLDINYLAKMHNVVSKELLESYDYGNPDYVGEMKRCIMALPGYKEEELQQMIEGLDNSNYWTNDIEESNERLISLVFDNIANSNFEHADELVEYLQIAIENINNLENRDMLVANNDMLLREAGMVLGDGEEMYVLESFVLVANNSSLLWLPEYMGGDGTLEKFLDSMDAGLDLASCKEAPRWLKAAVMADCSAAAAGFLIGAWVMAACPASAMAVLGGIAADAGIQSVVAAVKAHVKEVKQNKPNHH